MSAGREVRPSRTLWFIDLDHESGMRHGGNLRWFNLSRQLVAAYYGFSPAGKILLHTLRDKPRGVYPPMIQP